MSHALNRLRHMLKDELFVRTPEGMCRRRAPRCSRSRCSGCSSPSNPRKGALFAKQCATRLFGVAEVPLRALLPLLSLRPQWATPSEHPAGRKPCRDKHDRDVFEGAVNL
jgi:hypothetical protein